MWCVCVYDEGGHVVACTWSFGHYACVDYVNVYAYGMLIIMLYNEEVLVMYAGVHVHAIMTKIY